MTDNNETEDKVTLTRKEYDELFQDSILLNFLRNAGIDNWDGYWIALKQFQEWNDE